MSIVGALVIGCGGSGSPSAPPGPAAQVLAIIDAPPVVTVLNTAPGNETTLSVTLRDKTGALFTGPASRSFSINDAAVATVTDAGTITAVSPGTTHVNVTVKAGGVTLTLTSIVVVRVPSVSETVMAPQFAFEPNEVHVMAGGSVTWVIGAVHHTVTFTTSGAPADVGESVNQSATRTFATAGTFAYGCSLHTGMTGTVRVH